MSPCTHPGPELPPFTRKDHTLLRLVAHDAWCGEHVSCPLTRSHSHGKYAGAKALNAAWPSSVQFYHRYSLNCPINGLFRVRKTLIRMNCIILRRQTVGSENNGAQYHNRIHGHESLIRQSDPS